MLYGHSTYFSQSKRLGQENETGANEEDEAARFGDNHATVLSSQDGLLWTGEIYMGRFFKMDLIYDTASDWLMVEGASCVNCEGNTYDIEPNLD